MFSWQEWWEWPMCLAGSYWVLPLQLCRTVNNRQQTAIEQWETRDNGLGKRLRASIRKRQFCCCQDKKRRAAICCQRTERGLWKNCSMTLGEQKRQILQKGDKLQLWKRCERKYIYIFNQMFFPSKGKQLREMCSLLPPCYFCETSTELVVNEQPLMSIESQRNEQAQH